MKSTPIRLMVLTTLACLWSVGICSAAEDKAEAAKDSKQPPRIQLAILLDTSGSMEGLINQARTQIWKIVNELATAKRGGQVPQLEVALYEYGKSSIPQAQGFLRMIVPLSGDLDKISEELFALTTNGGQEYCGQVIDAATKQLQWSDNGNDLKLIFVAGNEPFTQGSVDYKTACSAAIGKGITVNTIYCGPEAAGVASGWQHGAQLADGSFMNIDQNQRVAAVTTPFDTQLTTLSSQVNKTYVAFGNKTDRLSRSRRQVAQDATAAKAAPAAAAERALFKGSAQYKATAWDLIDALKAGKVKLEDLKDDQLPKELQKLSLDDKKKVLKEKEASRAKIQQQIQDLSKQRKQYIADAAKKRAAAKPGEAESLDTAIIQTIRTQAAKKSFKFAKE